MHIRQTRVHVYQNESGGVDAKVSESWLCGLFKATSVYTLIANNSYTGNYKWVNEDGYCESYYMNERLDAEFRKQNVLGNIVANFNE